jgi:Leucine-rich repeat (LRR) protein
LSALPALASLDLTNCQGISDEGLLHLSALKALDDLTLAGCSISNRGLEYLAGCAGLTTLVLDGCYQISDGGLAHLGALKQLQFLDLSFCTSVTEGGLAHVAHVKTLIKPNGA